VPLSLSIILSDLEVGTLLAQLSVSVPMILSDPEKRDMRSPIFPAYLHMYVRAVWRRSTKFGMIMMWWRGVFLWRSDRPLRSQIWGHLPMPIWFDLERPNSARYHIWGRTCS